MIQKLKQNYQLSNVLSFVAFVLAYVFCQWQTLTYACNEAYTQMSANISHIGGLGFVFTCVTCGAIIGFVLSILLQFGFNFLLNSTHIYSVPRAEYSVIVRFYFALGFAVCGVLKIVNYFTPLFLLWGNVLFPFVSLTVVGWLFYKRTAKLYFNSATLPNYFKTCLLVYVIIAVLGVLL